MTTTVNDTTQTNTDTVWLVLAQVGPDHEIEGDEDHVLMGLIVMAERPTEAAAMAEAKRRNATNDGRSYFVMSNAEYLGTTIDT